MINRTEIAIGAIGVIIAHLHVLEALSGDAQDHRYLHRHLNLAFLGRIDHVQVAQMITFVLIMAIR